MLDEATLPVAAHDTVGTRIGRVHCANGAARIDRACLAVAGPVEGRNASLTNAHWRIDADAFAERLKIGEVVLCNDFEAAAFGLDARRSVGLP